MKMEKYFCNPQIYQSKIIDSSEIIFSKMVSDACKANVCGKYGTCWTCPPGVGPQEELEKRIKTYKNAFVFSCKYDLEDSFDFEGMMDGQKHTLDILKDIAEDMRNDGNEIMVLGCGACGICSKCTYPDAACRFPDKAFTSVEACGINVVELSRKIGITYNNGANTVTYFCIVLFD